MNHILVVDDEAEIRSSLEEILNEEGYSVATAATGAEALVLLQAGYGLLHALQEGLRVRRIVDRRPAECPWRVAKTGEALVLLTTRDLSQEKIRELLLAAGLPNLWVPRTVKRVEKIPILGSGKLDLGRCKELALS